MSFFKSLKQAFEKLEKLQMGFCVLCLAVIVIVLSLEILLRHLINVHLQWALDLSALLMVWICFVGSSMVYRSKGHIGIEALVRVFPRGLQKGISVSMYILIGAGFIVLTLKAASLMAVQWGQEIVSLGISRSFLSLPVVLGIGLMVITSVYLTLEEISSSSTDHTVSIPSSQERYDESY